MWPQDDERSFWFCRLHLGQAISVNIFFVYHGQNYNHNHHHHPLINTGKKRKKTTQKQNKQKTISNTTNKNNHQKDKQKVCSFVKMWCDNNIFCISIGYQCSGTLHNLLHIAECARVCWCYCNSNGKYLPSAGLVLLLQTIFVHCGVVLLEWATFTFEKEWVLNREGNIVIVSKQLWSNPRERKKKEKKKARV